ncbi:MAG: hypothetical protein WC690_03950 [bacterium]
MKAGHPFLIASDIHRAEDATVLSRAVVQAETMFAENATGYLDAARCFGTLQHKG